MSVFWKSFSGSFFGKICAGFFIAICVAFGVGPEKWVEFITPWFNPISARVTFVTLGLITFVFLTKPWVLFKKKYLSLEEAALKSYESLEGTFVSDLIERLNSDDVLGYYKQAFIYNGLRLYAQRPPSTVQKKIPTDSNRIWVFVGNDAYGLGDEKPTYVSCFVKDKDVRKYIKHIKKEHAKEKQKRR